MADTELNISPDEKVAGVPLARLLRNLDETSYNEGSADLACRLTDCRAVIEELLQQRALASRPAETDDQIPRESNDALIALARYWKLNGDWMTCKGCRRSLIASRDGEELAHGDGCKYWDQQHPWAQLRELITRRPAPAGAAQ